MVKLHRMGEKGETFSLSSEASNLYYMASVRKAYDFYFGK